MAGRSHERRLSDALHGYRTRRWAVATPAVLTLDLLERPVSPTTRNAVRTTDITCNRTWHGRPFLAVVINRFSRMVVGWAAGQTIHRELTLSAPASAVTQRRPRGTIIHAERECKAVVLPDGVSAVPITSTRARAGRATAGTRPWSSRSSAA
jgi:transposase InsO family protein